MYYIVDESDAASIFQKKHNLYHRWMGRLCFCVGDENVCEI